MNIRDIENAIIEKLKTVFPEVLVQGFPDKPAEFILLHPIGALLVHYQGSNYTSTDALGFISQENKKEFSITVVTSEKTREHTNISTKLKPSLQVLHLTVVQN